MKPLIYLEIRQFINAIKNTTRSPKRLIPVILGAFWVGGWFLQSMLLWAGNGITQRHPQIQILKSVPYDTIEMVAFIFLTIASAMVMYQAFSSGLMVFSIAQIDFLFPTPISRRKVLLLKLLKDYIKWGFWIAFFFLFIGSPMYSALGVSLMPWGLVSIAAMLALALTVVNLAHTINIVFTFGYERLRQAGVLIKVLLVAAPLSAVAYGIYEFAATGSSFASLLTAVKSPVVGTIFAPAKWCSEMFLAPLLEVTPEEWGHFGLLWLCAAGSFVLLMSRKENVYEPTLGVSVKYARQRAAMRSSDFTSLRMAAIREKGTHKVRGWSVPPFGLGATAFLWKSLVIRYRIHRNQLLLMVVLPLLMIVALARFVPVDLMRNAPFFLLYIVWTLSFTAQAEARIDLRFANITKAMPIAAWKLVLAQVTSSVLYLGGGLLMMSAYLWFAVPQARTELLAACALGGPFLGFACISAVTIPALMYPDVKDAAQNYLCAMLGFLLTGVIAAPTAVLGAALYFVASVPLLVITAIVSVLNVVLGLACISLAGGIFRKFDPTSE